MKKRILFRALKEVGAFHAYQINMNTGKFSWAGVKKMTNPYNYLNSASSFDWMKTIQGWDFWNKTLDKVEEKRYLWKKTISLET